MFNLLSAILLESPPCEALLTEATGVTDPTLQVAGRMRTSLPVIRLHLSLSIDVGKTKEAQNNESNLKTVRFLFYSTSKVAVGWLGSHSESHGGSREVDSEGD